MENLMDKINAAYHEMKKDAQLQIEKANKAAGTRARKSSLEVEKMMKEFRKKSLEVTKK